MTALGSQIEECSQRWRLLVRHWNNTRDLWDDAVRERFERAVWVEFEKTVPAVLGSMDRLATLITKVEGSIR
jgi:hypothetical protein